MEGAYGCGICQKAFSVPNSLLNHVENVHSSTKAPLEFEMKNGPQDLVKNNKFEDNQSKKIAPEAIDKFEKNNDDDGMDKPWNEMWRIEFLKNIEIKLKFDKDEEIRHGIQLDEINNKEIEKVETNVKG